MHNETIKKLLAELVAIPPGEFVMGSGNELYSESPQHVVRIEAPLQIVSGLRIVIDR
jgi:formylglycine-generating enzyme required for sulfatase activity